MVPGVLIVGSLPESDAEAGGARGREALLRLEKVFGRVQSPWLPASGNETYEIVRRRLHPSSLVVVITRVLAVGADRRLHHFQPLVHRFAWSQ